MMRKNNIEILFKTHYTRMYRLAASILYDDDEARDAVSEVFSRLIAKNISLLPDTAETYLLTAVRNQCRNMIERKQVHERFLRLLSEKAIWRRPFFILPLAPFPPVPPVCVQLYPESY